MRTPSRATTLGRRWTTVLAAGVAAVLTACGTAEPEQPADTAPSGTTAPVTATTEPTESTGATEPTGSADPGSPATTSTSPAEAAPVGLLVAAGPAGMSTSQDGATWTTAAASPAASQIAYGDGMFVAVEPVGQYPDTGSIVWASRNGTTWEQLAELPEVVVGVEYDDHWWIAGYDDSAEAAGDTDSIGMVLYDSQDAAAWNRSALDIPFDDLDDAYSGISSFSAGGGRWLVEASGYLGDAPQQAVFTSTDQGAGWTELDWIDPSSEYTNTVGFGMRFAWDGTRWGGVGNQAELVSLEAPFVSHARGGFSPDGTSWALAGAAPEDMGFLSLTWDEDRQWLAVAERGVSPETSTSVMVSTDLVTWTELGSPDGGVTDVAVVPGPLPGVAAGTGSAAPTAGTATTAAATGPGTEPTVVDGACIYQGPFSTMQLTADPAGSVACDEMTATVLAFQSGEGTPQGVRSVLLESGWYCYGASVGETEQTGGYGYCEQEASGRQFVLGPVR